MISRVCLGALALLAMSCAATAKGPPRQMAVMLPDCVDAAFWTGEACAPREAAAPLVTKAQADIDQLLLEEADGQLAAADAVQKPLDWHIKLWQARAMRAAFAEDQAGAVKAYLRILAMAPTFLLPYTLSPRATFPFEAARRELDSTTTTELSVTLPTAPRVDRAMNVDINVVADPASLLARGTLYVRNETAGKASPWRLATFTMAPRGQAMRLVVPAVGGKKDVRLQMYLVGHDKAGNEVWQWGSRQRARTLDVDWVAPTPWHRKWWVWAAAGVVVAGAAAAIVYATTAEPDNLIDVPVNFR